LARTLILGGTLLTPDQSLPGQVLVIEDGRILGIESNPDAVSVRKGDQVVQADGLWVAPGLIDLHVHGSAGSDAMDATPEALKTMASYFVRHGVTAYLPTTVTGPAEAIQAAVENVARFRSQRRPAGRTLAPGRSAGISPLV
jgi:N-acetylglucosamine-6-phosphate deacetylase